MKIISLLSPHQTLKLISLWPPFLFSGISVVTINSDVTAITARKKSSFLNTNYMGTHFGGSLCAMCDPFYAFILLHHLKDEHIIWDTGADIEFVKATSDPVFATFQISPREILKIKNQCLENFKQETVFSTEIVDETGNCVARVKRKVYVRRKDAKSRFSHKISDHTSPSAAGVHQATSKQRLLISSKIQKAAFDTTF